MSTGHNLIWCHTCPLARYGAGGIATCSKTGHGIVEHAEAGDCPAGKFDQRQPPKKPATIVAVPESEWPLPVKWVAVFRVDADEGVGDTVKRTLDDLGIGSIAEFYEKVTGKDCGCGDRAAKLNALYPYPRTPPPAPAPT